VRRLWGHSESVTITEALGEVETVTGEGFLPSTEGAEYEDAAKVVKLPTA
jgi:hypothetical protein